MIFYCCFTRNRFYIFIEYEPPYTSVIQLHYIKKIDYVNMKNYFTHFTSIINFMCFRCLKRFLTPIFIEKPYVREMCGRICSILLLFLPVSDYDFKNMLNSLNLIYENINSDLGK